MKHIRTISRDHITDIPTGSTLFTSDAEAWGYLYVRKEEDGHYDLTAVTPLTVQEILALIEENERLAKLADNRESSPPADHTAAIKALTEENARLIAHNDRLVEGQIVTREVPIAREVPVHLSPEGFVSLVERISKAVR